MRIKNYIAKPRHKTDPCDGPAADAVDAAPDAVIASASVLCGCQSKAANSRVGAARVAAVPDHSADS